MAKVRRTYELPAARALRWVFFLMPLVFVGIGVGLYLEQGDRLLRDPFQLLPVVFTVLLVPVFLFATFGRMAHTIVREGDRLTFKAYFRTVEMRFADIRTISTRVPFTRRKHMGGMAGGNMLAFEATDEKVHVMGLFTGLVDLINDIREANPNLELDGL